jgi:hypothetical protein
VSVNKHGPRLHAARGQGTANQSDPVLRLAGLYAGRRDVQGAEGGVCLKTPVTWGHYRGHLRGDIVLGIYPLMPDGTCAWAAVDIDTGDLGAALELQRLLRDHNLPAIVLTSRAKGYHVTVFFAGWASACHARRVLRALTEEAGLPSHTEIFPKADIADTIGAGNYLRLPYPGALPAGRPGRYTAAPGRRVALDPTNPNRVLPLMEFLALAESSRVTPDVLDRVHETLGLDEPDHLDVQHADRPEGSRPKQDPGALGLSAELTALVRDGWSSASKYPSRSEAQQAVVNGLFHVGHDDQTIRAVLSCPDYGISARVIEGTPRKRAADIDRCIRKARASHLGRPKAQPHRVPAVELHRCLRDAAMPPLAWPIVFEIMATTDYATGLSLMTAPSLARRFGIGPATVYRALSQLRAAGFLEPVPLAQSAGQWSRVAHRLIASSANPTPLTTEPRAGAAGSVRYEKTITSERRSKNQQAESGRCSRPSITSETRHRLSPVRDGEMAGHAGNGSGASA